MGLWREQRVLMTILKWCAIIPYVPPGPKTTSRLKFVRRVYWLRVGTMLVIIFVISFHRLREMMQGFSLTSVTFIMWLLAVIVESLAIILVLLVNAFNATRFRSLTEQLERLEGAIEARMVRQRRTTYPCYGLASTVLMLSCVAYHSLQFYRNYTVQLSVLLQLRWEVLVADIYTVQIALVLVAVGRRARQLRQLLHDAIGSQNVANVCAVLRMRDDLVGIVASVDQYYGIFFFSCSVSWVVWITCILYFDFVLCGAFVLDAASLVAHWITLAWKSIVVGGLVMLAGLASDRVKEILVTANFHEAPPCTNRALAKLLDKAHVKCHFQDICFTAYGLFTIDNSLCYKVGCSIVTYLVILIQFKELEENI